MSSADAGCQRLLQLTQSGLALFVDTSGVSSEGPVQLDMKPGPLDSKDDDSISDLILRRGQKETPLHLRVGFLIGYEFGIRVVHFKSTQRTDGFYLEFEPPASGNLFVFYLRPYQKLNYHIQTMVNTFGDNTLGIPYKVPTFFY